LNKVNVGVIGVGAMGYNHARVYYRLEEANLMAISDITKGTLAKVSKNMMLKVLLIMKIFWKCQK